MEKGKEKIYYEMKSLHIRIESIYGEESEFDFSEINKKLYKSKFSLLVFDNDYVTFNCEDDERYKIIKIENEEFLLLPPELNVPRYKYKIISDEKTYLFFKSNNRESLKETMEKNKKGMEEEKIRKFLTDILKQVKILHSDKLVHGNINPCYIVPFDKGVMILDIVISTMINEDFKVERNRIQKNFKYSSPEVIENRRSLREEDDYWSIGMIALEMCLGRIPFDVDEYFNLKRDKIEKLIEEKGYSKELNNRISELLFNKMYMLSLFF